MASGSISKSQFIESVSYFMQQSDSIGDLWVCRKNVDDGLPYLSKRISVVCSNNDDSKIEDVTSDLQTDDDEVQTNWPSYTYDYHIVYSHSYSVPVLYFNAYHPASDQKGQNLAPWSYQVSGYESLSPKLERHAQKNPIPHAHIYLSNRGGSLLRLNEVWENVCGDHLERLQDHRWSMLTQQEHPVLMRPFYQLHPCHTADFMRPFCESSASDIRHYLVTWLSTVAPVVHLDVSLSYARPPD